MAAGGWGQPGGQAEWSQISIPNRNVIIANNLAVQPPGGQRPRQPGTPLGQHGAAVCVECAAVSCCIWCTAGAQPTSPSSSTLRCRLPNRSERRSMRPCCCIAQSPMHCALCSCQLAVCLPRLRCIWPRQLSLLLPARRWAPFTFWSPCPTAMNTPRGPARSPLACPPRCQQTKGWSSGEDRALASWQLTVCQRQQGAGHARKHAVCSGACSSPGCACTTGVAREQHTQARPLPALFSLHSSGASHGSSAGAT